MRKITMALAAALIGSWMTAGAALAADKQPVYAVVDMGKVMQSSDAAKKVFAELEAKRKEFQGQIAKEEETLRDAQKEIEKKRSDMTAEEFEKKRKAWDEKVINGQKMAQEKKMTLDRAFNTSVMKLKSEAAKIVAGIAKEKGFSAVFTQDAVMLSVPDMDITDAVIKEMNSSVKKVSIDWSAAKSGDKKD